MNKKLLALAIGSALGAAPMAASFAKVTVGGHLQVEVNSYEIDNGVGGPLDVDATAVQDNSRGRIIIAAEEKLGNGMTALARFEFKVDTTDGSTFSGSRESMVGLKGNFGQFEAGSIKSAYKYAGGVTYDPFVATALEARNNGGMTGGIYGHNGFLDRSIGYQSNSFSGFTVRATYSLDDNVISDTAVNEGDYSLSGIYKNGPLELFVAAVRNDSNPSTATAIDYEAVKVGGQYKFNNHTLSAQWESADATTNIAGTTSTETDTWFVGWQMAMGNNTFVIQYGQTEASNSPGSATGNTDTTYWAAGVIHNLSKNTRVHVGYRSTEVDVSGGTASDVDTTVFGVGLRVIF